MTRRRRGCDDPGSCPRVAKIRVCGKFFNAGGSDGCSRLRGAGEGGQSSHGAYAMDIYSRLQSPELPIWHQRVIVPNNVLRIQHK